MVVQHAGLAWANPPGRITDRPHGAGCWQINLFHDPVLVRWRGRQQRLAAPAAVIFSPRQAQWYCGAEGGFSDDWLNCTGQLPALLARYGLRAGEPFRIADAVAVEGCLAAIHRELTERPLFADEALSDLVRTLLRLLARGRMPVAAADPRGRAIDRLRRLLREHHAEAWPIERMAREAGMRPHAFAVHYRRRCGATPLRELTWFRLRHAHALLSAGRGTVAAIAAECGFSDALYFSRLFKRWTGRPPSACLPILGRGDG